MRPKRNLDFAGKELSGIISSGLYRRMRAVRVLGSRVEVSGRSLINLSSNDYLGIPSSEHDAGQEQSSSRLLSGTDPAHEELERELASHKLQDGALLYPTGYMANIGALQALAGKGDHIISDEANHASIIDACRLSGARVSVYGHNDMCDLSSKIRGEARRTFIVTEGIFSMDGRYAPLDDIVGEAQAHGAITVIDDAHGDFVAGCDGRGTPDKFGVAGEVDVYISSLSKALGSFGGYVASDSRVIDLCVNRSRAFIYTSALPSSQVRRSHARLLADREPRRKALSRNVAAVSGGLRRIGYSVESDTHIMPIQMGGEQDAVAMSEFLYERGIFANPIRYPTVPKGQAMLRISVTAWLSEGEIEEALGALDAAYSRFF